MNLIVGCVGLASVIGIVAWMVLGSWFWLSGNTGYAIMASALTVSLAGFLYFNISKGKNKIFMGDTGSLIIGFIIAVMIIRFNEVNSGTNGFHNLVSSPAVSIAIIFVPLFDTLRVFTVRILCGRHPFKADKSHIHHLMLKAGFSHIESTLIISLVHILIIITAFIFDSIGILWLSLVLILIGIILTWVVFILASKKKMAENVVGLVSQKILLALSKVNSNIF